MAANSVLASMAVKISANTAQFNTSLADTNKKLDGFGSKISSTLKGVIAGFGALEIGSQIIKITGEFQKFEAVLSNTLGSQSKAQEALSLIKDFASSTPFAVNELTASFVKLANQGFVPTQNQLRSLGDLASSTGKSFDQLTEAVIDAQVGEFERLKEFGIRAQKQGDQVKFTFKGVQTQVAFTSDAIRDYVLSLGDAVGVSGSMEKISGTLEGRISNLKDSFDNLLLTVGNSSSGPLFGIVESLTKITTAAANLNAELDLVGQAISPFRDLKDIEKGSLGYLLKSGRTDTGKQVSDVLKPITGQSNDEFFKNVNQNLRDFITLLKQEGESVSDATVLWQYYLEQRVKSTAADAEAEKAARENAVKNAIGQAAKNYEDALKKTSKASKQSIVDTEALNKKFKDLSDTLNYSFGSNKNINDLNKQIKELKEQLEFNTDTSLSSGINDHIKTIEDQINNLNEGISVKKPDWETFAKNFKLPDYILEQLKKDFQAISDTFTVDLGPAIAGFVTDFSQSLGELIGGSEGIGKFSENIKKAIGNLMISIGSGLIALGIGKIAAKIPGPAAIAAGVVLVAAGAALSASTKKMGNVLGSGSESGGSNQTRTIDNYQAGSFNIVINDGKPFEFRLAGDQLVAMEKKSAYVTSKRG